VRADCHAEDVERQEVLKSVPVVTDVMT